LERSEAEQIEKIGVESRKTVSHALIQERVETGAPTQHPVDELARPTSIARVEVVFVAHAPVERCVEQLARAKIGTDRRGRSPCVGDSARRYDSRRRAA
jgi:adenylosuccinate synthase